MAALDQGAVPSAAPLAEAKAHFRLTGDSDDAVMTALLSSATQLCEAFTGLALVQRQVRETLPITGRWYRLALTPVTAITLVEGLPADGAAFTLPVGHYAIDIDMLGDGWVQISQPGIAGRARATYSAGLAADAAAVPDALRQGIILLAEHLYRLRDRVDGRADGRTDGRGREPPAAIAALWRPWRRMRLS